MFSAEQNESPEPTTVEQTRQQNILTRKLRKLLGKGILLRLYFVSRHLKPCYLWDACEPTAAIARTCILRCWTSFSETGTLHVLCAGSDILICNVVQTVRHLNPAALWNKVRFVDVTATEGFPKLLKQSPAELNNMLTSLLCQLQQVLKSPDSVGDNVATTVLELNPRWNLCSMFGVLLGFPVVYWFQGGSDAANCLSMEELRVVSVRCSNVPCLVQDSKVQVSEHEVYSFSFPVRWEVELSAHVKAWFDKLCSDFPDYQLTMTCRDRCYPIVAL